MTFWWSLLRAWGFGITVPLALALGVAGAVLGSSAALIPMVRLPVPVGTLMPVVAVLVLSWTLHDRWTMVTATAVRSRSQVTLALYVATAATCVAPVLIGTPTWGTTEPVSITLLGVALAALLVPVLRGRLWAAVLVGGYLWLLYASRLPVGDALVADVPIAVVGTVLAASTLAVNARRG